MNHVTVKPTNFDEVEQIGEPCPDCGDVMNMGEGCEKCESCGYSAC